MAEEKTLKLIYMRVAENQRNTVTKTVRKMAREKEWDRGKSIQKNMHKHFIVAISLR